MYVFRFSLTAWFNVDIFLLLSYPSKYRLIASGLFFSVTLLFLLPKNLVTSVFISSSVLLEPPSDWTNPVNSSSEFGLLKIEAGELLSNSPSGAQ